MNYLSLAFARANFLQLAQEVFPDGHGRGYGVGLASAQGMIILWMGGSLNRDHHQVRFSYG